MALNRARVWLGGLAGGAVWVGWSFVVEAVYLGHRYQAAQASGQFLKESRYPFFLPQWIVMTLVLGVVMAHLYAWSRVTLGPGPKTALKLGFLVGFVAGFPNAFSQASYLPIARAFPLAWMLELWVGAILATLVAGYTYKE